MSANFDLALRHLNAAISLVGDCERAYREASDTVRRQFNQAFFTQILVDDEYTITGEYAKPFDLLLSDDLRQAAAIRSNENLRAAVEEALGQREDDELSLTPAPTSRNRSSWAPNSPGPRTGRPGFE